MAGLFAARVLAEAFGAVIVLDRDPLPDELEALADRSTLGPETVYREDIDKGTVDALKEWEDDDAWQEALEEAFEKAEIPRSKGTLTIKTIDGREYYYLQWREGDSVKSQYVAPVSLAS
jgi:hypothetical protein